MKKIIRKRTCLYWIFRKHEENNISLLDFPDEVLLQIFDKLNLVDRINLSRTHKRLSPLFFDRSLQRKSTETLTLNELRQLYKQSKTENERNQCFKSNVLDRLLIKNINDVVRLYMDPKNKEFVTNDKILHSLRGQFVLEREKKKFSASFVDQFLCLLEKAEGTLLLAFVDIELGEMHAKQCARILSNKFLRGHKVYCIAFNSNRCGVQIKNHLSENNFRFNIFSNFLVLFDINGIKEAKSHNIAIEKRNSVANTKDLINMINGDSLREAKQHLEKVLALVEAEDFQGGVWNIRCDHCSVVKTNPSKELMVFDINEHAF